MRGGVVLLRLLLNKSLHIIFAPLVIVIPNSLAMINKDDKNWNQKKAEIFWAEVSPTDHLVQIYENDTIFLDTLESFVHAGLKADEVTVVIATTSHLKALESRLVSKGVDIVAARKADQYITMEAGHAMAKFMVDSWPNEIKFNQFVYGIIERAKGRRIRAFGEMVALMWGQGFSRAAIQLEHLWNVFCHSGAFCLFCAYPDSGITKDLRTSITDICSQHSTVIAGWNEQAAEVFYKTETV